MTPVLPGVPAWLVLPVLAVMVVSRWVRGYLTFKIDSAARFE